MAGGVQEINALPGGALNEGREVGRVFVSLFSLIDLSLGGGGGI